MVSDQVLIGSDGRGMERAIEESERVARYIGMGKRDALRTRLLTEETIGMMRMFVDGVEALFWIEIHQRGTCEIHVQMNAKVNNETRKELIAVSSSGKNEAARGFMGKLGDLIARGLSEYEEVSRLQIEYGTGYGFFNAMGGYEVENASVIGASWSLAHYRSGLESKKNEDDKAREAWDELEKSIVANIADDVLVTIKGELVEMVIIKKFRI